MAAESALEQVAALTPLAANPLVSIIVPSYNQGRFIRRTLESILSQDYRPIEVIVIDGASADETVSILREYDLVPELRWISEPDSGVVEAVNKGFALTNGQIGAIQSSDDFYMPGAISAGVDALQSNPSLAFAFGDIAKVDANGSEFFRTSLAPYSLLAVLTFDTWIPQPSTFFRLEIAKALGGWRNIAPYAADTDLWLRMALQFPAAKIEKTLAQYSIHDAQRDKQGGRIFRDYARAIETLPGLKQMPTDVQRAAKAGTWLLANQYDPANWELKRVLRLWLAIATYPSLYTRYPWWALAPFGPHFRKSLSVAARFLGLRESPNQAQR